MGGFDFSTHSEHLDQADEVIKTPPAEDVRIYDIAEVKERLNSIEKPNERLKTFLKSVFDVSGTSTHEGEYVRRLLVYGFLGGWLFGGILRNKDFHEDFVRRNNAAFFQNQYVALRKANDTYLYSLMTKGVRFGLGTGLLMSAGGFVCLASTSYRNDAYLPDWMLGLGAVGAVSRCWLGLRGMTAGAVIGSTTGLVLFGLLKAYDTITRDSVVKRRYLHHQEWRSKEEAKLERLKRFREKWERENPKF